VRLVHHNWQRFASSLRSVRISGDLYDQFINIGERFTSVIRPVTILEICTISSSRLATIRIGVSISDHLEICALSLSRLATICIGVSISDHLEICALSLSRLATIRIGDSISGHLVICTIRLSGLATLRFLHPISDHFGDLYDQPIKISTRTFFHDRCPYLMCFGTCDVTARGRPYPP